MIRTLIGRTMQVLRALGSRRRFERELSEEIRFHLEMEREKNLRAGMSPAEAHRRALLAFGGVERHKEALRTGAGLAWATGLGADLRFGLRALRRSPGAAAVVVLAVGIAIGAGGILFSFVNAFFLRPLPVPEPGRLIAVYTSDYGGGRLGGISLADYRDFAGAAAGAADLLAEADLGVGMSAGGPVEVVQAAVVSESYFRVLDLRPARGRFFAPGDEAPGADPVVVLSHDAWRRRFAMDPGVVGKVVRLNGQAFTVVGVAPARFAGVSRERVREAWVPASAAALLLPSTDVARDRGDRRFLVLGRLSPGAAPAEVSARLSAAAARLHAADPAAWRDHWGRGRVVTVLPEAKARFAGMRDADLALVFGGVFLLSLGLLALACGNVVSLQLARASARRREIAVRLALGAGRFRLVRQLLVESSLLAAAGALLGLVVMRWATASLMRLRPAGLPNLDFSLDARLVAFIAAGAVVAVLLFGLAPALRASRPELTRDLKEEPGSGARGSRLGVRGALIVGQVALSLLFTATTARVVDALARGGPRDAGFRADGVVLAPLALAPVALDTAAGLAFGESLVARVKELPGVTDAALAWTVPLGPSRITLGVRARGGAGAAADVGSDANVVGPGYFRLMEIPVVEGREFAPGDRRGATPVAVVSAALARRLWPGRSPIGQRLSSELTPGELEVVGVAADLRTGPRATAGMLYLPATQHYGTEPLLHARVEGDAVAAAAAVGRALRELAPEVPVREVLPMEEYLRRAQAPQRVFGVAVGGVAVLQLLLALAGLYGIIAWATAQRTREIGVRMALGARGRDVMLLVLRQGLRVAGLGVALGLALAVAAGPVVAGMVSSPGGGPSPLVLAGAVAAVVAAAVGALVVPARQALRVEPSVALRHGQ